MMDDLMRDLQVLWKADSLIGRIWLNVIARRLGLFVFAALIAVCGLGMANVAGFYGLQPAYGFVWSAVIVAVVDFVLAALVLSLASRAQPGNELELALEVRKMAIASLLSDTADVRLAVDFGPKGYPANQGQHRGLRPKSAERGGGEAACSCGAVVVERTALEEGAGLTSMHGYAPRRCGHSWRPLRSASCVRERPLHGCASGALGAPAHRTEKSCLRNPGQPLHPSRW